MRNIKSLVIHASLDKVELMVSAKEKINQLNIEPILPDLHRYQHIRDEYGDFESFDRIKYKLARENCENMARGNGLLILNPPHRSYQGYVGGASFSQMVIAFYFRKPIFLTHVPDNNLPYCEEIRSFLPIMICAEQSKWTEETFNNDENSPGIP